MSRAFAILVGICFLALGTATLTLIGHSAYSMVAGGLFCLTGTACLLHKEHPRPNQQKRDE